MLTATVLFPAVRGLTSVVLGALRQLRAATDHMVELDSRKRTGQVRRQLVVLEMSLTPEGFLEATKNPAVRRGIQDFELLRMLGELDRCKTCGHLVTQEQPITERSH
jgi:hypothetical protein